MNSRYYYAFDDSIPARAVNACSRATEDFPLFVNCAGNLVTSEAFTTDNVQGRADYYFLYIVSGKMAVDLDDGAVEALAGSVIVFPPRYHYRYVYSGGEPLSYLWVHFTGSYAEKLLTRLFEKKLPFIVSIPGENKLAGDFRKLFDVFETGGMFRTEELACSLEAMLIDAAFAAGKGCESRNFERSLRYIHSFYNKEITVESLAAMENISYYRYIKLFREKIGVPPTTYLINLRMNAACDLLANTDMSIKQIGVSVGYDDAHFFSRLFKKHTGMSPKEYRSGLFADYSSGRT